MFAIIVFNIFLFVVTVTCQCSNTAKCVPQIPKCCAVGEVLIDRSCTYLEPELYNFTIGLYVGVDPIKNPKEYKLIPNKLCENAVMVRDFYIQNDGTLLIPETNEFLTVDEYCVEVNVDVDQPPYQLGLWCYNVEDVMEQPHVVFSVGPQDNRILFGDKCSQNGDCGFNGSVCEMGKCGCQELLVTNHINMCGKPVRVNETCSFSEQCEAVTPETECRDGICSCRFEKQPISNPEGKIECIVVQNVYHEGRYVDPAMIGILVAMFLMFITICVVLRLFSRARWRENRTIFNTPNPRLMNVSLLRENKLLHQDRRGSRTSARGPSRQPSMTSIRAHSPNSQGRLFLGSRRGSRGSSNASATSNRSNKSPPQAPNMSSATTPMLESVTVEIQEPKA